MGGIIVICIILVTMFFVAIGMIKYGMNKAVYDINEKGNAMLKEGAIWIADVSYISGIRGLLNSEKGKVKIFLKYISVVLPSRNMNIDLKDVISIDAKSETEISKDVTVMRLITLGIFAFAAKKTTETIRKFFIITYNDTDKVRRLIFESNDTELIIKVYDSIEGDKDNHLIKNLSL